MNAPSEAVVRPFMTFQAFIDDSRSDDGTFVLAGAISTEESWAKFAADWEELLPLAPLDGNLRRSFSFHEILRAGDERVQYLPAFGKAISSHIICSILFVMQTSDLKRAQVRIQNPVSP